MDVVCVGDCGVDVYQPAGERRFGGITANFARHARDTFPADDRVSVVTCVGDDDDSMLVRAGLEDTGLDCHITTIAGRTPVQTIEIAPDGEKRFTGYDAGVLADFRFDAAQVRLIAASDLLVAPVYLQIVGLYDALMKIGTHGRVSVDFADFLEHPDFGLLERYIDSIDIGFFGLNSADGDAIEALRRLAAGYGKLFVITLGADGSLAFECGVRYEHRAEPVSAVRDTTGAGDAYAAAFLARYCHGKGVADAMTAGAIRAAGVVQHVGTYK